MTILLRIARILNWPFPQGMADIVISSLTVAILSFMAIAWWHLSKQNEVVNILATGVLGPPYLAVATLYTLLFIGAGKTISELIIQTGIIFRKHYYSYTPDKTSTTIEAYTIFSRRLYMFSFFAILLLLLGCASYSFKMQLLTKDNVFSSATNKISTTTDLDKPTTKTNTVMANVAINLTAEKAKKDNDLKSDWKGQLILTSAWLLALLLVSWWTLQAVIFLVAIQRSRAAHPIWWSFQPTDPIHLTSTQWQTLDHILHNIQTTSKRRHQNGKAFALRGDFGSGKSFLLHQLERCLAGASNKVLAYSDSRDPQEVSPTTEADIPYVKIQVWSEETEHDLQFAILRGLLLHPAVLFTSLWQEMLTPSLTTRLALRQLQRAVRQIRLKTSVVEFDVNTGVLLPWQPYLVKLTALAPTGMVIVLDEIDRSVPKSAQAAMTIVKRSLDLPGISVIVPYVPDQIRYKVFNPLTCEINDLSSSMFADIWGVLLKERKDNELLRTLLAQEPFKQHSEKTGADSTATTVQKTIVRERIPQPSVLEATDWLRNGLSAWYLDWLDEMGLTGYERIVRRFEEKYLPHRIEIPSLQPHDIYPLVSAVPELAAALRSIGVHLSPDILRQACQNAYKQAWKSRGAPRVNLRQFITLLDERFARMNATPDSYTEVDIAVLIAFTYYRAIVMGN